MQARASRALGLIWMILVLFPPAALYSQDRAAARAALSRGTELMAAGDTKAAKKAFESAIRSDKTLSEAHAALGRLAIQTEDWGDAAGRFGKILKADPENLEALYYRGIAFRESGKFKPKFAHDIPLVKKLLEFQKAENDFKAIVGRDSSFKDVLFQFALLERYRDNFFSALDLAHRQIALRPELLEPRIGIFDLYRRCITHTGTAEIEQRFTDSPHAIAKFHVAEKYRRSGELLEAESVLRELLTEKLDFPVQAVYLALTRIYFSRGQNKLAENCYFQAINRIRDELGARLVYNDLRYLLKDAELDKYESLKTARERIAFFQAFWIQRNPLPAADLNERLAVHYKRLVFAESNYEYDGFHSWANSADKLSRLEFPRAYQFNDVFNDKGLIYLRHGNPDDRIITKSPGVPSNESWKYWGTEGSQELTFHFLYPDNVSGNLWRLTPFVNEAAMWEDRIDWDPLYHKLLTTSNPGEQAQYEEQLIQEGITSVETGFATDRHTWEKRISPLTVPFSLATYRGSDDSTTVEIYFGVSVASLSRVMLPGAGEVLVEKGIALYDENWQEIKKERQLVSVPLDMDRLKMSQVFIDAFDTRVAPGTYFLSFHIRPENSSLIGGFSNLQVAVPPYRGDSLQISDIQLAAKIQPAGSARKFVRNDLQILPNPSRYFGKEAPVYVYFELYNLALDSEGKSGFSVNYTVSSNRKKRSVGNLFGLFGGGKGNSVTLGAERQANAPFSPEFLAIDVKKLGKGPVTLRVEVTDKLTGATAVRENRFTIY